MRARVGTLRLAVLHLLHRSHTFCQGDAVPDGVYKGEGRWGGGVLTQASSMETKLRMMKPTLSSSSINSFITTSGSSQKSTSSNAVPTPPPMPPAPVQPEDRGVGLSDPTQSAGRRRMLELVNRMHNTG